jgi:hypothetical protein
MGEMRNAYKIFIGKPEGNRSFGKPRHKWEHNKDLKEMSWEFADWIHLAEHRDQ